MGYSLAVRKDSTIARLFTFFRLQFVYLEVSDWKE